MPTVVGLPQVQNYDTSGSQPLYNKNTSDPSGNLMDFIVGLGKVVKQKQDENKEADQALGQIDAINGVVREVGLLHQQNYNEGQKYGAIVQDHVKKDAQFKQNLNDLIASNPEATPEDVQELATQQQGKKWQLYLLVVKVLRIKHYLQICISRFLSSMHSV